MDYPCLEILLNGESVMTFTNLDFKDCGINTFIDCFKRMSRDGKIVCLYSNKFIKRDHIEACRNEHIQIIFHKTDYDGDVVDL